MKNKTLEIISNVALGIILIVLGTLMLSNPNETIRYLTIGTGIVLFVYGIINLIDIKKWKLKDFVLRVTLIKGLVMLLIGALAIIYPLSTSHFFVTWFQWLYAIILLFVAFASIYNAINIRGTGFSSTHLIIEAAVSIFVAIILIIGDFRGVIVTILGIGAIILGGVFIASSILFAKK